MRPTPASGRHWSDITDSERKPASSRGAKKPSKWRMKGCILVDIFHVDTFRKKLHAVSQGSVLNLDLLDTVCGHSN